MTSIGRCNHLIIKHSFLLRDQKVAGSNPVTSTNETRNPQGIAGFLMSFILPSDSPFFPSVTNIVTNSVTNRFFPKQVLIGLFLLDPM